MYLFDQILSALLKLCSTKNHRLFIGIILFLMYFVSRVGVVVVVVVVVVGRLRYGDGRRSCCSGPLGRGDGFILSQSMAFINT